MTSSDTTGTIHDRTSTGSGRNTKGHPSTCRRHTYHFVQTGPPKRVAFLVPGTTHLSPSLTPENTVVTSRFWAKVEKGGEGDCWNWTAATSRGYGCFWIETRAYLAHRVAYELLVGEIPDGHELDHLCRNHGCVNPAHLEPVDHKTNVLRGEGLAAKNAAKTHCIRGHSLAHASVKPNGHRSCNQCRRERRLLAA